MKFYYRLLAAIIGVAIALVQPQIAVTSTAQDVSKTAEEITVLINGLKLGSGVIIQRQENIYSVLTNWHVVDEQGTYEVQTPDSRRYQVNSIKRISGVDLAVLQFTSSQKYNVAQLRNSDTAIVGTTVYVSGAPEPLQGIEQRTVLVTDGKVVGIHQKPQDGYIWIYNNNTYRGMSGGPILDENGRLIGIHGRGARSPGSDEKVGFNLGIPINSFIASEVGRQLGVVATSSRTSVQASSPSSPQPDYPTTFILSSVVSAETLGSLKQ